MLFPIISFFIFYKFYNLFIATAAAMISGIFEFGIPMLWKKKIDKTQCIELVILLALGGATLILRNPMLIKWKVTLVYWAFAICFIQSHFRKVYFIQHIIPKNFHLSRKAWKRLNASWSIFFTVLGGLNLYIAYSFSTNTWVNFKFFGLLTATAIFSIIQGIYLYYQTKQNSQSTLSL